MMTDLSDSRGHVVRMMASLETDDEVVEPALRRVLTEVASYGSVDPSEIAASVRQITQRACHTLLTGAVPRVDELWEAERTTLDRLRAGLPIEDILTGFRITVSAIQHRLTELAAEQGLDGAESIDLTSLLWKLSDAFSARGAAAYRDQGSALTIADQRRRDQWLMAALAGDLSPDQVSKGYTVYHLRRDRLYHAFCTGSRDESTIQQSFDALAGQQQHPGLIAPAADRLVGIVATPPTAVPGLLLAVGPPVRVEDLALSYRSAQRILETAALHALEGVHTAESLGWRLAASPDGEMSKVLRSRYLEPLSSAGRFGDEVIDALRAYLANGRSVPQTGAAMHLHVNTLRYRLERFEQLTGRSLRDTDTVVELALVLYSSPPKSSTCARRGRPPLRSHRQNGA